MTAGIYASRGGFAVWRRRAPAGLVRALVVLAMALLASGLALADGVRILEDDREALQARADMVARATSHIELSYFCIGSDELALGLVGLLHDAARRGVKVRILVDAMHNEIPAAIQDELVRSGVEIREYHPPRLDRPGWITTRLHDKLWLIDGREMITGGRNIEARYFGFAEVNFRDRDVYVVGDAAAAAVRYFDAIWQHEEVSPRTASPPAGRTNVPVAGRRIYGAPSAAPAAHPAQARQQLSAAKAALFARYGVLPAAANVVPPPTFENAKVWFLFDPPGAKTKASGVSDDLERIVAAARREIDIETPYLVLSDRFQAALGAARGRGVNVRIATNSLASTNSVLAQAGYTAQRGTMRGLGIELWEYRGPRCLHAKSFVIDGRLSLIGSFNLDPRSELQDTQVAVLIDDPRVAAQLAGLHAGNRANAIAYGGEEPQGPDPAPEVQPQRKALFGVSRLVWPLFKDQL